MKIKKKKVLIKINGRNTKLNLSKNQTSYLKEKFNISNIEDLDDTIVKLLKEKLMTIKDVRQTGKKHYKLWDILMYVILASFSNVDSWYDIHDFVEIHQTWLKRFLKMTGGIPTRQTIERVMSLIDAKELENVLTSFFIMITTLNTTTKDIVNIDGRVDCGSSRNKTFYKEKIKPLNSMNTPRSKLRGVFIYIDKNLTKLTKYKSLHIFLNFKTSAIETIYKDKIYTISIQKTLNYYNFTLKRGKYIVTSIKKSKSINDLTKVLDYLIQLD